MSYRPPTPRFDGQFLFGDDAAFAWSPLVGGAASVDGFLGLTPGTTLYGNAGAMYGLEGRFVAATAPAVQAMIDTLASYADLSCPLGLPTAIRRVGEDFVWSPWWCRFLPQEFIPGTIQPSPGGQSAAPYRIVFRQVVAR